MASEEVENVTKQATEVISRVKEIEAINKGKQDIQQRIEEQKQVLREIEAKKEEIKSIESTVDRKTGELKKMLFDKQIQAITSGELTPVKKEETAKEYAARVMGDIK